MNDCDVDKAVNVRTEVVVPVSLYSLWRRPTHQLQDQAGLQMTDHVMFLCAYKLKTHLFTMCFTD